MLHEWRECEPVRFHVDDGFVECSLECANCGAKVPPDWPEDFMMRFVWDVPEACEGPGWTQPSLLSKV